MKDATIGQIAKTLETVGVCMNDAFRLMNAYAKNPYNGNGPGSHAGTSPHAVLAEVYMILAPAQQAMQALEGGGE